MNSLPEIVLDVLRSRRSIRRFSSEKPSLQAIEKLTEAGQYAPFALIGTSGKGPVRTFFVLERDSARRIAVQHAFATRARRMAQLGGTWLGPHILRILDIIRTRRILPITVYRQMGVLMRQAASQTGHFKEISTAPYWIIVAEKRRTPAMATALVRQSLAHSLQNMWIMATAMGLGFQLVSLASMLADDASVCEALDIQPGEFEFDACLVGKPSTS